MKNWDNLKKELLSDKKVKAEYEKLKPQYRIVSQLIELRKSKNITQKELAEKMGTKQSAIARIESGSVNPTVKFLEKIASSLNSKLIIRFE